MNDYVEKNTKKEKSKINRIRIESCLIGLTLVTGVVGYEVTKDNDFTRIVNENGDYELEGFISYDELKKYNVVEMETITGENVLTWPHLVSLHINSDVYIRLLLIRSVLNTPKSSLFQFDMCAQMILFLSYVRMCLPILV